MLDERDRQILALLQADAWLSYVELSKPVHLSASAVQRRVERLKRDGVLKGARAIVSDVSAPPRLRIFALVDLVDDRSATVNKFRRQIAGDRLVVEAHYVTGESDILLTLEVENMDAYDAFVRRHFGGSSLVRRFKSLTSLRALKASV